MQNKKMINCEKYILADFKPFSIFIKNFRNIDLAVSKKIGKKDRDTQILFKSLKSYMT